MAQTPQDFVRDLINRLQNPVPDLKTLLSLLSSPLHCLGLLPPRFLSLLDSPLPSRSINTSTHIPVLQRVLLTHISPTWDILLSEQNAIQLLEQYFCPDGFDSPIAGDLALMAYATLTSQPLTTYAIHLLERLVIGYPMDRLYFAIFKDPRDTTPVQMLAWEDFVRSVIIVPGKVSNAIAGSSAVPFVLEHATYFNNVSTQTECLISKICDRPLEGSMPALSYLFSKLVSMGIFPPTPPVMRSQPSFFKTTLPTIHTRLNDHQPSEYSKIWSSLFRELPSSAVLQSITTSLLSSLGQTASIEDVTAIQRAVVRRKAQLLTGITGKITPDIEDLWEAVVAIILQKDRDMRYARVFVCWLSGGSVDGIVDEAALSVLIEQIASMWSSPDHVKHSLLSRHQYVTCLLLVAVSYLVPDSQAAISLALSPSFISGVGLYINHLDQSVRRCGMLAAEVVAQRAGKKLDFKDWEGDDSGKPWARAVRELLKQRDVDANLSIVELEETESFEKSSEREVIPSVSEAAAQLAISVATAAGYDSDDSITGYDSPPSSRSASPTRSELDEIEKDPSVNVGAKKVMRPVYLAQLGDLLRNTGGQSSNEPHEADKIEMALNHAEELIRKKRGYGMELDENAVNLVYALLGLQDNYNLTGFETKRQGTLNALIACAPKKAAPSLIEEFFKNQYSTSQRYVALNALALGAREMASLPLPPPNVDLGRISFPSKLLPPSLHQQYLTEGRQNSVNLIMDVISNDAIERGKQASSSKVPELVRERRLRVAKSPGIAPVASTQSLVVSQPLLPPALTPFTKVATEYFITPLINRFWLFLRDERAREERTAHRQGRERYHGAGTGLILNPVVLSHFLGTLAILVHASQNAPEWLAIIAPDALELAVTIGTRPVSQLETDDEDDEEHASQRGKEGAVLTSALELTLVVLDGCLEVDGGRVLGLEHTTLLFGAREWATEVFNQLEKGLRVQGGGGIVETKLKRAAAGVLLKVDELMSRWQRSMLDIR